MKNICFAALRASTGMTKQSFVSMHFFPQSSIPTLKLSNAV
jgi:hypothetical protein